MITRKINVKLSDWELKAKPIYHSRRKRAWYCEECKLYTESPRSIALHADEHDIKLPNSRPQANMHKINQNENLSSNVEDFSHMKSLDEEIEEINANSFPSLITLTKESMNPFYVAMRTGETFDSVIGTFLDKKWYPKPLFTDP